MDIEKTLSLKVINEPVELDRDGVADTAAHKVQDNIQGGSNPILLPHWLYCSIFC